MKMKFNFIKENFLIFQEAEKTLSIAAGKIPDKVDEELDKQSQAERQVQAQAAAEELLKFPKQKEIKINDKKIKLDLPFKARVSVLQYLNEEQKHPAVIEVNQGTDRGLLVYDNEADTFAYAADINLRDFAIQLGDYRNQFWTEHEFTYTNGVLKIRKLTAGNFIGINKEPKKPADEKEALAITSASRFFLDENTLKIKFPNGPKNETSGLRTVKIEKPKHLRNLKFFLSFDKNAKSPLLVIQDFRGGVIRHSIGLNQGLELATFDDSLGKFYNFEITQDAIKITPKN